MSKQSRDNVASGNNGWEATVNNNFIKLFDRPVPIFLHTGDETTINGTFPAATHDEALVVIDDTQVGLVFYMVDKNHPSGSATWVPLSGRGLPRRFVAQADTVLLGHDDLMVLGTPTAAAIYTMRPAAEMRGQTVVVKNLAAFTITMDANAAETIDGALTDVIPVAPGVGRYYCDGTAWHKV